MISDKELEKTVLALVNSPNYKPIKPRIIAKKLDMMEEQRLVKKALKRLIKKGLIAWGPKHLVVQVNQDATNVKRSKGSKNAKGDKGNETRGVFRRASAGYGFVTPAGFYCNRPKRRRLHPQTKNAGCI